MTAPRNKLKYKPCCNRVCAMGMCKTTLAGGCYCVCRLIDEIGMLKDLISGRSFRSNGAIVSLPQRAARKSKMIDYPHKQRSIDEESLKLKREKLKTYEIKPDEEISVSGQKDEK